MKVVTANRLADGAVVWLRPDHSWSVDIAQAAIAPDDAAGEGLLAAGRAGIARNEVVDVAIIAVERVDGALRPVRLRERIRLFGPTVGSSIGKTFGPGHSTAA